MAESEVEKGIGVIRHMLNNGVVSINKEALNYFSDLLEKTREGEKIRAKFNAARQMLIEQGVQPRIGGYFAKDSLPYTERSVDEEIERRVKGATA